MRKHPRLLHRLFHNADGPTAVEYAVMLALIVALCLPSVVALSRNAKLRFLIVNNSLSRSG